MTALPTIKRLLWTTAIAVLLMLIPRPGSGQPNGRVKHFKVKDNTMHIILSRNLSSVDVDSFIIKYNLRDIGLTRFMKFGKDDSLLLMGWSIEQTDPEVYVISKELTSAEPTVYPGGKIVFSPVPTPDDWRVVGGNRITYGFNLFRSDQEFRREKDIVYFHLRGYPDAKKVRLAGNFTNWQHGAFPMTKSGDGWSVSVKLQPGQYYYKFIVDNRWMIDPFNKLSENDGRGNENSVYFVTNKIFELKGYTEAHNVYLAGSFNNWAPDKIPLARTQEGWRIDLYLEKGTYSYQFIVDGNIIKVRDNIRQGLSIGEPYVFILKGFTGASKVILAGNFNDWKENELQMKKTADGWTLPYVLGPGNYQYKFIIDGRWITDPSNPSIVNDGKGNLNSFLVIGANYPFHLKGYPEAKNVFLAGDFNNWSPQGLRMVRKGDAWVCSVFLAKGKHLYKFIVDGWPVRDPANKAWEEDGSGSGNSVIWIDPNAP